MPRARCCISSGICCSDEFLDLSTDAQALYTQCNLNADSNGIITGMRALLRLAGAQPTALDELMAHGFILDCGGGFYAVRHWWLHNVRSKVYVAKCNLLADGLLGFEGAEFGSAYVLTKSGPDSASKQRHASQVQSSQLDETCYGTTYENQQPEFVYQCPPTFEQVEQYAINEEMQIGMGDELERWYSQHQRQGWVNQRGEPLRAQVMDSETGEVLSGWQLYLRRLDRKFYRDMGGEE